MTEQKQQMGLESLASYAYGCLRKAVESGDVRDAVTASEAYSVVIDIGKRELEKIQIGMGSGGMDMGLWGLFYASNIAVFPSLPPSVTGRERAGNERMQLSNPFQALYPYLAEFFYGEGAGSGLADSLRGVTPRRHRSTTLLFSEVHLVPNEMIDYGYTMGYDKSPGILDTFRIIRGPKRPLPS